MPLLPIADGILIGALAFGVLASHSQQPRDEIGRAHV